MQLGEASGELIPVWITLLQTRVSAISTPFNNERVRLWTGSALAVLLVYLAVAILLLLRIHGRQPVLRGTADAFDVEIAGPLSPVAAPSAAVVKVQQQPTPPPRKPRVAAVQPVKPLAQLQPIAPQPEQSLSVAPPAADSATPTAAESSAPPVQDLAVSGPTLGQPNAPPSPEEQWLAQVIALLERYKSYPPSAMKRHQQDTVMLQFKVNHAGMVVSSSVDSQHHYRVLEDEVRKMLQQASPLPPLPKLVSQSDQWQVPIDFYLREPAPVVTNCKKSADPGAAPSGTEATPAQMQAYQARLNQYVAAARSEFNCLGGGSEAAALAARVKGLVDGFNGQARAFQAKASAQALQAQQARQAAAARLAQAQAAAARGYAACAPPSTPHGPSAATEKYRKELLGYEATVRAYVACIQQVQLAAGSALPAAQRAVLARPAVQLANAAVLPLDQSVAVYNAQLQTLQAREQTLESLNVRNRQSLLDPQHFAAARALVNTWDTPAPLLPGNCIRILRSGRTYQAQLCKSSYTPPSPATPGVSSGTIFGHAGRPTFGIGSPPAPATNGRQTISYSLSAVQVIGTHLILTIDRKSDVASATKDDDWSSAYFDVTLSTDGRRLVGQCRTAQKLWDCQLPRHQ